MSQVLNPLSFPLHGTRLIEASAGTGKTYTIAALYVRLILQHGGDAAFGRPLAPQNILVVTFTNAATEELRDRIRRRLSEAAQAFRQLADAGLDPFLQALREDYPQAQWPALAHRLEQAANCMDEAAVHTIHGWAQRMLRQHAFDSGSRFNLKLEADDRELYREAAQDYWRTFLYPLELDLLEALLNCADCPDRLADCVRQWPHQSGTAADGDYLAAQRAWSQRRAEREAEARAAWRAEREELLVWFEQALADGWLHGSSHKPDATRALLAELEAWANGEGAFDAASHGKLSGTGMRLTKKAQAPTFKALTALDELVACLAEAPDLRPAFFSHAKHWCEKRVEQVKQRRAVLSFDDLLTRLDRALQSGNGEALANLIRERYPVALIDEFQDTDPVQYRMFRSIYLQQPQCGLLMIGDPKQAIYAFRGADIFTYLQARRDTGNQLFTLDTNFRSTQALVAGVNRLFVHADRFDAGAFLFRRDIPFTPVAAKGRSERLLVAGEPVPAITLWHDPSPRNKSTYLRDCAEATATHIVSLLQGAQTGTAGFDDGQGLRPVTPADIAILVRDGGEARAIREALASRGLRSAYLSDRESVFDSREAADLLLWLQAVANPEFEARLRIALASPTLQLSLAELDTAGADGSQWEERVESFLHYRKLWQQKGVLVMLARLMDDFDLPARLLRTSAVGGERSLTNLLQLGELLQQAAMALDGEQALIRHLAERIADAREGRGEEFVQRLESDEALIKVVTIHKSKGLEYPLVFLPFIGTSRPVEKKGRLYFAYHDEEGRRQLDFDLSDTARAQADRERLAEDLRLLYVAVTRARHACWIGLTPLGRQNKTGYSCQLSQSAIGQVLNGGKAIEPDQLETCLQELVKECEHMALQSLPEPAPTRFDGVAAGVMLEKARDASRRAGDPWWITSYSSVIFNARLPQAGEAPAFGLEPVSPMMLAEETAAQAVAGEGLAEPDERRLVPVSQTDGLDLHQFPKGARSGVFLHGLLEWLVREGLERVFQQPERVRDQLARRCQRRGWEHWIDPLQQWSEQFLRTPLQLPDAAGHVVLAQLSSDQIQPELEFWFATNQTAVQAVDRLLHEHILPGQRRPLLQPQVLNGMLKGFIDLVFEHEGRFYLADYKSNWLGPDSQAYTQSAMEAAMLEHRYDLQYVLYTLALHRLLRVRLLDYDYERHLGGVLYLFLRGVGPEGQGVYASRPPRSLIEELDQLFAASLDGEVANGR